MLSWCAHPADHKESARTVMRRAVIVVLHAESAGKCYIWSRSTFSLIPRPELMLTFTDPLPLSGEGVPSHEPTLAHRVTRDNGRGRDHLCPVPRLRKRRGAVRPRNLNMTRRHKFVSVRIWVCTYDKLRSSPKLGSFYVVLDNFDTHFAGFGI